MPKKALITGITGQDGSYLAEFLLSMGYEVFGLVRRTSTLKYERIRHIQDHITLISGDMGDQTSLTKALMQVQPDEVYNLAAQSFVQTSWHQPVFTGDVTALGVTRLLDAIMAVNPKIRFYQASSSEMFGKVQEVPQKETTPFYPRSPYGVAKTYGHWITVNYRESYGIHASSGILFNHECVTGSTPVFIRKDGLIDLLPIADLVSTQGTKHSVLLTADQQFETWDAHGWTKVTCMTATWNGTGAKTVHRIASAGAIYHATSDHQVFVCQNGQPIEQPAGDVRTGDQLALLAIPTPPNLWTLSPDEAYQLGVTIAQDDLARIPQRILNADHASRLAFLQGFESIRLFDSATEVLAAGLYWLIATTYSQAITIQFDQTRYHLIADHGQTPLDRVTQATPIAYTDWLYDFATESGTFHAGIGQGWIHNSPRRGLEFVTRKVTYHAAMIKLHLAKELRMGNLDAQRDWGFAGDYVKAMWMMLQQPVPDDFVVATGETHSVERLLEVAFSTLDLNWKDYVVQDERFMRPAEVDLLIGDPSKAKHILNWSPEVSFEGLVQMMVEHDLQTLKRGGE